MPGADLRIEDAVNATCPWSGKPIAPDSLTRYRGVVVGSTRATPPAGDDSDDDDDA